MIILCMESFRWGSYNAKRWSFRKQYTDTQQLFILSEKNKTKKKKSEAVLSARFEPENPRQRQRLSSHILPAELSKHCTIYDAIIFCFNTNITVCIETLMNRWLHSINNSITNGCFLVNDTEMTSVKFQIHSSNIQATLANDFLNITEHVWECYYKDCMGLLHTIANFSTNIKLNQINICILKSHIKKIN